MSVRSGEAANAEEITQQSVSEEEPVYGRYETEYAQRERERHKEYNYNQECNNYNVRATTTN